jgi:hypothetical protein
MSCKDRRAEQDKEKAEDRTEQMTVDQEKASQTSLDAHAADAIARQLKATYSELLEEPIPSRFRDLLDKLGAEQSGRSQTSKSSKDEA